MFSSPLRANLIYVSSFFVAKSVGFSFLYALKEVRK